MDNPNLLDNISLAPGMQLIQGAHGMSTLAINGGAHASTMQFVPITQHLYAGVVDFFLESCPSITSADAPPSDSTSDLWFTVNYCIEGRCEVIVPAGGFVVVEPGDVCASYSKRLPDEFRYPMGRYRGIELFVNSAVVQDAEFAVLREAGVDLASWARRVDAAAIFSQDDEIARCMGQLGRHAQSGDTARAKLDFMNLVLRMTDYDLDAARPRSFLTKGQRGIAVAAREELDADLSRPHDVREMARRANVSATTLNEYFSRVYGMTIAAYLRKRRMDCAMELLGDSSQGIADIAIACGYANPSKFSAAFKRICGTSPREWRRLNSRGGSEEGVRA